MDDQESFNIWERSSLPNGKDGKPIAHSSLIFGVSIGVATSSIAIWNPIKNQSKVIKAISHSNDPTDIQSISQRFKQLQQAAEEYIAQKRAQYFPEIKSIKCSRLVLCLSDAFSQTMQKQISKCLQEKHQIEHISHLSAPIAAALSYGLLNVGKKIVLVVDIGASAAACSVLSIDNGRSRIAASCSCTHAGGSFINALIKSHVKNYLSSHDLLQTETTLSIDQEKHLTTLCCLAKESLTTFAKSSYSIVIPQDFLKESFTKDKNKKQKQEVTTVSLDHATIDRLLQEFVVEAFEQSIYQLLQSWLHTTIATTICPPRIDEVVLAGGGFASVTTILRSCIQKQLQLHQLKREEHLDSQDLEVEMELEFCSSIDPKEVIVEGLAIRGAVLSGLNIALLQDVLMIDMLPSNIGLMTWPSSSSNSSGGDSRIFEAILLKGSRIPAVGRKRFPLENKEEVEHHHHHHHRMITLDVYEEVDYAMDEDGTRFRLMGNFNVPIPQEIYSRRDRFVDIDMRLTAAGELFFDVLPSAGEGESQGGDSDDTVSVVDKETGQTILLLTVSILALLLLYILVKVYLSESQDVPPENETLSKNTSDRQTLLKDPLEF